MASRLAAAVHLCIAESPPRCTGRHGERVTMGCEDRCALARALALCRAQRICRGARETRGRRWQNEEGPTPAPPGLRAASALTSACATTTCPAATACCALEAGPPAVSVAEGVAEVSAQRNHGFGCAAVSTSTAVGSSTVCVLLADVRRRAQCCIRS